MPVQGHRTSANPNDVKVVLHALLNAKNPIIRAGEGVLYAHAWNELREFAELTQIPVMTTIKGKSSFPEDHPLSLGYGGCTATRTVKHFLERTDLIFSIGSSLTTWWLDAPIPPGKKTIQLTIDEFDMNKDCTNDYIIMGDAKLTLRQLIEELKKKSSPVPENQTLLREIRNIKDEWLKEWMPKLTSDEVPINPYRVIWDFMQTVDRKNTIVTADSGMPRDMLAPFYESLIPRGYIGWGNATTLGFSLGAAMGAKLAEPEKRVTCFMGDAAIGMTGMDFETASRAKIPILTIILNNSVLSGYGSSAQNMKPSKYYLYGDYAKLAEALRGYGETVENPDEIIPAIKRAEKAIDAGKPALLNVITKEELAIPQYW
jgi:acetolactate synthase-1/2/3 large subunit